jgi:uncharacterized protein (TIGR02246 family)
MKPRALAAALVTVTACATAGAAGPPPRDAAAEEAAIRVLEDQERSAVLAQDFAALERLWSEDFTVNTPRGDVSAGRGAVLALFRQGIAAYASFDRRIELIRFSGDHALVMGGETVRPIGNAPLAGQTVERRFTNVWRREDGTWRLFARHANVVARP